MPNKRQRLLQLRQYSGSAKLVFERWISRITHDEDGYDVTVKYTVTTGRIEQVSESGESFLPTVRKAWRKAYHRHHTLSEYHRKRKYEWFEFDETANQLTHFEHNGHSLTLTRDANYTCAICHQWWDWKPADDCPNCRVFSGLWDDAFNRAEQVLGFKPLTKGQMSDEGYQTGKKLPAPAAAFHYSKSKSGYLFAYNPSDGIPKKSLSPAQKEALEKARYMAEKLPVVCSSCKNEIAQDYGYWTITRKEYLSDQDFYDTYTCHFCDDEIEAIEWAKGVLEDDDVIILDTETTDKPGEPVEITVINNKGNVLFNERVQPEGEMSEGAQAVHGIAIEELLDKPKFPYFYEDLRSIIRGKRLIIYNVDFDLPLLQDTCHRYGLDPFEPDTAECAMLWYAQFFGDWSSYWGNYKWQPLDGGHSALADCLATLQRIKSMANYERKTEDA